MTIEQAVKKLIALHACAEQSEKIKGDPLVWALKQVLVFAERDADAQAQEVKRNG